MLKSGADGTFSMNLPTNPGIGDNDETQLVFSASAAGYTFKKGSIVLGKGSSVSSQLAVVELTPIASSNSGSSGSGNNGNTGAKVKLSAPASVSATDTNSSSLTVEWDQVTDASGYAVYYAKEANFPLSGQKLQSGFIANVVGFGKKDVLNGATTSVKLTGLQVDSTYYFKIIAKGIGNYSNSDASTQKTASTKKAALPKLTLSKHSSQTYNRFDIRWSSFTKPSGATLLYDAYYSKTDNFNIGDAGVTKVEFRGTWGC